MTPEQRFLEAIVAQLFKGGVFDHTDVLEIADGLDEQSDATPDEREVLGDMSNGLRVMLLESLAPKDRPISREQARQMLRVIDGGGK